MNMNKIVYKKGQRIDAMTTAGTDMEQWEEFGIVADIFRTDFGIEIPTIYSKEMGSGKLDDFLEALKKEAGDTPLRFNTVINGGLAKHLVKAKIAFN